MALVRCRECGQTVSTEAPSCPHCGCQEPWRGSPEAAFAPGAGVQPYFGSALPSGNDPALLPQVRGWNLGAFWFNWIWCFAHNQIGWGIAILVISFIPYVSIINLGFAIYLGVKGNELAWERRRFRSLEQFRATERVWRAWALGFMIAAGALLVLIIVIAVIGATLEQGSSYY